MGRFELNNLTKVVKDVGNGKQPLGTIFETINLVPTKKVGSLANRNGYVPGLDAPSGISTLDKHLTAPVTYPSSIDYHLYFFRDAGTNRHITINPYFHNSSSAGAVNNGWVDIADKVTFTVNAQFKTDTTINASPTNTYVLAAATTTYGLSATTNYYKNWILWITTSVVGVTSSTPFLVESYSVTAGVATFTLDTVINIISSATLDKTHITAASLQRFFHYDKYFQSGVDQSAPFTPSYTTPACYFTDTAVRFSGGAGTLAGYKNLWYGYIDRTFFNSVTANKYRFQGSYCDQAEIFAPINATGTLQILKSIGQTNAFASEVITNEVDRSMGAGNHWVGAGTHPSVKSKYNDDDIITIQTTGEGDATTNNVSLTNSYTNALSASVAYKVKIEYMALEDCIMYMEINGQTISGQMAKTKSSVLPNPFGSTKSTEKSFTESRVIFLDFTSSGTTAPSIKFWFNNANLINILSMNVYLYSDSLATLRKGRTLKYYAVYIYDGFQRSNPQYLGAQFFTIAAPKATIVLRLRLGQLNKRVTAIESYCTLEDGDTTSNTAVRTAPLYFMHSIPLCDTDTGWSFATATGNFEYTDTITGVDFQTLGDTWEQRAKRIENSSLTCSYTIAENCAGRIFTAQYYDYVAARFYTNAIRYTNFDKFGVMCPDVLSNVDDEFVSYINAGAGTNITTLFERKGELVIGKEASVLRIATNQSKIFWQPIVITNSVGVLNDDVMQSLGNTMIWTDDGGVYRWDGGEVELWGDGIWSQFYRENKTSNQLAWIDRYDGSYNLTLNNAAGTFYKLYQNSPFPYQQTLANFPTNVAVIKNGRVYFESANGTSYLFAIAESVGLVYFSPQFKTGAFTISQEKFAYIKQIELDLEITGTPANTLEIAYLADGVQVVSVPVVTTSLKRIRFNPPLVPARTIEIRVNYGSSPLVLDTGVTYNWLGIDYDEEEIFGDVKAL